MLQVVAVLLAFDDFAHASAFHGRNMDERVGAAVVRLNETELISGIEQIRRPPRKQTEQPKSRIS